MKTWIIAGKDLRRVWKHAAALLALVWLGLALGWIEFRWTPWAPTMLARAYIVLQFVMYALTFVIAATIVHEDVLLGTRAFWLTRPIRRSRLFAAKLLSVGLACVALPVAAHLPWWLWFRFEWPDLGAAALQTAVGFGLVAMAATLVASLTDTFTRLVVWTLVLAAAIVCGPGLWTIMTFQTMRRSQDLMVEQVLVAVPFTALAGLLIIGVQYLTRRWFVAAAFTVAAVAGVAVITVKVPADVVFGSMFDPSAERNAGLATAIQVSPGRPMIGAPVEFERPELSQYKGFMPLRMPLVLSGVRSTDELRVVPGNPELRWPNRIVLHMPGVYVPDSITPLFKALRMAEPVPDVETQRWWAWERERHRMAMGRPSLREERPDKESRISMLLRPELLRRIVEDRPRFTCSTTFRLLRPRLVLEIPVTPTPGEARDESRLAESSRRADRYVIRSGYGIRLLQSVAYLRPHFRDDGDDPQLRCTVAEAAPKFWSDVIRPERLPPLRLYALDRTAGTELQRDFGGEGDFAAPHGQSALTFGCVTLSFRTRTIRPMRVRRGDKWVPFDPDFAQHASLALVRIDEVARFRRSFVIEHFLPEPEPAKPATAADAVGN
jgi:hypothetical protein